MRIERIEQGSNFISTAQAENASNSTEQSGNDSGNTSQVLDLSSKLQTKLYSNHCNDCGDSSSDKPLEEDKVHDLSISTIRENNLSSIQSTVVPTGTSSVENEQATCDIGEFDDKNMATTSEVAKIGDVGTLLQPKIKEPKDLSKSSPSDSLKTFKIDSEKCADLEHTEGALIKFVSNEPRCVLKHVLETEEKIDMIISCSDGKLGAHKVLLASASSFLKMLLLQQRGNDVITLVLPDISKSVMEYLLSLIYTGEMIFPPNQENDVYEAMQCLLIGEFANFTLQKVIVKKPEIVPPSAANPTNTTSMTQPVLLNGTAQSMSSQSQPSTSTSMPALETEYEEYELHDDGLPDESESDDIETEDENESVSEKNISSTSLGLDGNGTLDCGGCNRKFGTLKGLRSHQARKRCYPRKGNGGIADEDLLTLLFCCVCNTHYNTFEEVNSCLIKHRRTRCWACLKIFRASDIRSHYALAHADDTCSISCRWCPALVKVKTSVSGPQIHAKTHILAALDILEKNVAQGAKDFRKRSRNPKETGLARFKKRKLDENGKYTQVAFRTGKPVGKIRVPKRIKLILDTYKQCDGLDIKCEENETVVLKREDFPEVLVQMERLKTKASDNIRVNNGIENGEHCEEDQSQNYFKTGIVDASNGKSIAEARESNVSTPVTVKVEVEDNDFPSGFEY